MTTVSEALQRLSPEKRALVSQRLRLQQAHITPDRIASLPRSAGDETFPLSFAQQRLWFLHHWDPLSTAYNVPVSFRLSGPIDVDSVVLALAGLVERHETLRTTFETVDEDPVQRIHPPFVPTVRLHDLRPFAPHEQHERVAAISWDHAREPFDLARGPLLRAALVWTADDAAQLLVTIHHISCDGWSMDVLLREFGELYGGQRDGRAVTLPPLPIQYADYAVWQRSRLTGDRLKRHLTYWEQELSGDLPVLELPTDFARPPVATGHGGRVGHRLPSSLIERLEDVSRDNHATLFMTAMAAFHVLLARYSGQKEVIVGTPIANRQRHEVEGLVGFFVNTLPIRADLTGDPTFVELLQQVRSRCLGAYEHQDLPFEQIIDALDIERRLDRTPLFQAMFILQNMMRTGEIASETAKVQFGGAESTGTSKFDVTMQLAGSDLVLEYAADILRPQTAAAMLDHFHVLLAAVANNPTTPVSQLPLLTSTEMALLDLWNDTEQPLPAYVSVLDMFAEHVAAHPHRPAVRFEDEVLTYAELEDRASRIALHLSKRGIQRGDRVALFIDRSVDLLAATLGVLRAGGAYVPLDVMYPTPRIAAMLAAADVRAVVTTSDLLANLPADRPETVCLDVDPLDGAPADSSQLTVPRAGADLMYVLFTSGSTGQPKPVPVTHANYVNYLVCIRRALDLPDGLSYALVSTFAADLGTTNVYGALCTGGMVHLVAYARATDPEACVAYFTQHQIDVMKLVPSHLEAFRATPGWEAVIPRHTLVLAGEAASADLARLVRAARPQVRLFNNYGPTETTVSMLSYTVPPDASDESGAVLPLGRPIGNVKVYVLDEDLQRVPPGVFGELYISGAGVSPGYLGLPEQTAVRFLDNPFDRVPPFDRMYRTGDRVRHRADGVIEFHGRVDHQVKIRGFRVEPSEVEAILERHTGVAAAVVVLREDRPGDKRLVAYWVPSITTPADEDQLRIHLRSQLPDYMVPGVLVELESIPVTLNGKVDRAALPLPNPSRRASASQLPTTPTELRIAQAWQAVLEVDTIGVDDNFFDLGGESFRAIRAVRRLGSEISVMDLFRLPTIRELAQRIDGVSDDETERLLFDLTPHVTTPGIATVVAVPYGGGSAVIYQPLARAMPPGFAVLAVDLPGHDFSRQGVGLEPLMELAERAAVEIVSRVDGPVVVYGHCVGSSLAVEIARQVEARGGEVIGVVLGGNFPAPRLPGRWFEMLAKVFPADRWMSDRIYRDFLRALGGFTEITDPDEQTFAMRSLRHDARQNEDYHTLVFRTPEAFTLRAPILCVIGEMDRATEFYAERFSEWEIFGTVVGLEVLPGAGHYFVKHQAVELAGIIGEHVERWSSLPQSAEAGCPNVRSAAVRTRTPQQGSRRISARPPDRSANERPQRVVSPRLTTFFVVAFGQFISLMGSSFTSFALGIWLYQRTGSVAIFATIAVVALLPSILVAPLAGAVADIYDRRRIMIANDVVAAACTLGLGYLVWANALEPWHIYVTAFVTSIGGTFQRPAYIAAMTQLVPKAYLGKASGVLQVNGAAGNLVAPLLGGALVGAVGLRGIFLIDLFSFCFAVGTLVIVRFPNRLFKKRDEPLLQEIVHGWRYIVERRPLVAMVTFFAVGNVWFGFANILAAPLVLSYATPGQWGVVAAAIAGGMLTGGLVMSLWGGTERRATGMVGFVVLEGVFIALSGLRPSVGLAAITLFGMWFCVSIVNAHWQLLIQTKVGLELQGRVLATNQMLAMLSIPLAYLLAGRLADNVFERWMAPGGVLTPVLGGVFGTGPGRGTGVLMSFTGVLTVFWALAGFFYRPLRRMEDDLPDAIPDAIIERLA